MPGSFHAIFGSCGRWPILRRELQGVATAFADTVFSVSQSAFCIVTFFARFEYVYNIIIDYMTNLDHGMIECIHWHVHYQHLMLRPDQARRPGPMIMMTTPLRLCHCTVSRYRDTLSSLCHGFTFADKVIVASVEL